MKNILLTIAFLACFIYNAGAQTDPTNPQVICLQSVEPYEVDAPNGTPGSTYTWSVTSPGFTGSIISGQGTNEIMIDWGSTPIGTYVLQVIETNLGCPGLPVTLNIEITEITLTEGTSPVNCNGGTDGSADITVNGGVSPYSYIWSNGTTTEDLTGLAAGSYTVTVTDANQCTATISVLVTEPLAGLTSIAVPANTTCGLDNGVIDLTVNGGVTPYSYIWSNGTTTEDLAGLAAGSYTVTVTDANQCTATESVVINDAAGPTLTEGTSPVNCNGGADGSADLTVNGGVSPYSYIWSNGTTTEDLTGLAAGSYTVTVTDANQCTATISVLVTEPLEGLTSLTVPANTTCGLDNGVIDLTVNGGVTPYSYIWSNGTTTEDLTGLAAGSYTVTVTDANQCTATESVVIDDSSVPTFTFPDITECDGVPIVLNGNPAGGVYSIPNPYTGPSTTYTYTYTDANGCTATATGTITINPLPNTSPIFHD